ncbi:photosystem II reaction center proteins PsbY, chloroplastic [Silene latifolia]|uniref:photosystem II reaction center proteins PsbY, chloroplastic n=1 Tax=Silene latifolia TaxID=37657 RepID=UPI003D77769D
MASTMATTMAILNTKCLTPNTTKMAISNPSKPTSKPISLLSIQNLPKGLINPTTSQKITSGAIAGAIFTTLGSVDPAMAAQQLADIAEGDNRGLALLLPLVPAIGWVLYNILQPALNQINKMRSERGVIIGLGLSGLGLLFSTQEAQAIEEIAKIAASSESDSRGLLLLIVVLPAIGWVLFNILQPALNQINKMRSQ